MRRNPGRWRSIALTTAVLALAGATPSALGVAGGTPAIPLNTEQETTGADTGASGFFSYTIEGDQFCYTLEARDLSVPATAAHIHFGDRNEAGGIVIHLMVGSGTDWTFSDCVTLDTPVELAARAGLLEDPRDNYVNDHTPTFPGGEIRGQLK